MSGCAGRIGACIVAGFCGRVLESAGEDVAQWLLNALLMNPQEGQIVGSVVLRHKIADGGMASVWAAEQVALNREVAVKFLAESSLTDAAAVQRFALEARTMTRVSSAYVPQVFEQGTAPDGTPYIVMELVPGVDLKTWVLERGNLNVAQAVRLVDHVSLAMGAAHELGIVPRDVKPENIILDGTATSFQAKLVDFGISKSTALSLSSPGLTLAGRIIGTPSYMSPEQLTNASDVDERSDVWSLGVVAYWALTGKLPFEGETFAAVCLAITRGHFIPPSEWRPDLPVELDAWFERALCRDREERFQSAELMSRMLKVAAAPRADVPEAALLAPVMRPKLESDPEICIGGVSQTVSPSVVVRLRHRRRAATYGVSAALFGLFIVCGLELTSRGTTNRMTDTRTLAAPVPASEPLALSSPPMQPRTPPREVPTSPDVGWRTHAPDRTPLPVAPRARAGVATRTPVGADLSSAPRTVAPAAAHVPMRAARAVREAGTSRSPKPSDWHPSDELGEP
jgi:serine/threonine protein kinase